MMTKRTVGSLSVAGLLVTAAILVSLGSPAGAAGPTTTTEAPTTTTTAAPDVYPTGSLVDNGDGTVTLTYADVDSENSKDVYVIFAASGSVCAADPLEMVSGATLFLTTATGFSNITASPMLIQAGTSVLSLVGYPFPDPVSTTLPAGDYETCLYAEAESGYALLSSAPMAVGVAPAPAPAPEPVAPAYTG